MIFGPCKSAGTLVALGADEIVMSDVGELGPLDVQTRKPDELMQVNSGLDIFEGLTVVSSQAFRVFESCFVDIVRNSGGSISAITAAEISRKLTADLYSPITAQIDPLRVGEMQRAIRIAEHYGKHLGSKNLKNDAIQSLVMDYPSHTSVIDIDEAQHLFHRVASPSDDERRLGQILGDLVNEPKAESTTLNLTEQLAQAREAAGDHHAGAEHEQHAGQDVPAADGGRGTNSGSSGTDNGSGDRTPGPGGSAPSSRKKGQRKQQSSQNGSHSPSE
jgi:hypothetical protein